MNEEGTVYIVHHVDTEGPLYEPIEEVFKRIEDILHIKLNLDPTVVNLKKLQDGSCDTFGKELSEEIKKIASPHLLNFKATWTEIDEMLYRIMNTSFRNKVVDSYGNGWVYNWHIIDHVGFLTNERRRDIGYLNIFNHYEELIKETGSVKDEVHWHFHPISFFKEAHIPATSYENSYHEIHQILCRRLIEKEWFPKVNRAGFHTIRPDSNWFLEQWIPFDASNQSIGENHSLQKDNKWGRFGDWDSAPDDWDIYNPDLYDWRKKGNLNRVVSRVLNLKTRFRNINVSEIEKAFEKNNEKKKSIYLGITNHDFREISTEIDDFLVMLNKVRNKFPQTKFKFSGSIEAFRKVLGFSDLEVQENKIDFDIELKDKLLKVSILNGDLFGPQPYLAFKTLCGNYYHDNFDFGKHKKEYYYTFDRYTMDLRLVQKIAVASNDRYGNTCIVSLSIESGQLIDYKKLTF